MQRARPDALGSGAARRLVPRLGHALKLGLAFLVGVFLLIALAAGLATESGRRRLQASGEIARTKLGPIQYSLHVSGSSSWYPAGEDAPAHSPPTVLLVHGTPGGNAQVQPLAESLAGHGLRVVTFSRPGYLGTPLASGAGFDEQADLAAALLDSLQIPEVMVIGISGGGAVALQITLRHPERVRALAMIAAVTFEPQGIGALADHPPDWRSDLRALGAMYRPELALRRCGIEDPAERKRLAGDPEVQRRLQVLFRSLAFSRLTNDGYRNDYVQSERQNPASYPLREIGVPTLGIYGRDDAVVPPAHGERLVREIEGAQMQVLPGPHAFFVLYEDAVLERLLPFLSRPLGGRCDPKPGEKA